MKEIRFIPNGKNRTAEIVEAVLQAESGTTFFFEKGVYDFYKEGAWKGYFFVCCNRNGEKKVVFPLLNKKNITIDGNGSTFLFHDRLFPFIIQNCENVVFKNFNVDFSFPRYLETFLGKTDESGFEITFKKEYEYEVNENGNLLIKAGSDIFSSSERKFSLNQAPWYRCYVSAGDIYYQNVNLAAEAVYCDAKKTENGVYFRYRDQNVKVRFLQEKPILFNFDELRENDVFFFEYTKNIFIENVRIIHAAGMGIVGQCCENMRLNKYMVSPNEEEMCSTTADALLLTNFRGKVTVEDCIFDRTNDDAIAICGFYTKVEQITDRNKAIVRLVHASQAGTNIYDPGDVLQISNGVTMEDTGKITVKSATLRDDPALIYMEFEEDIQDKFQAGDYLGNYDRTPEIEIRNCTFNKIPHIRLSSSQKTIFENNVVKDSGGLLLHDLMRYWYVTGCVNDVTVQNNIFDGVGVHAYVDRLSTSNVMNKNITVVGNRFKNVKNAIVMENVDGLLIRDNQFENVEEEIKIVNCQNERVE